MSIVQDSPALIGGAVAFTCGLLGILHSARRDAQQRVQDLALVERAMADHYAAVDKLLDDPATTPDMLATIDLMNRVMSDKAFVDYFFNSGGLDGLKSMKSAADSKAGAAFAQVEKLHVSRPDLEAAFHTALATATMVMFLRWPGRSQQFKDFAVGALTRPKAAEAQLAGKLFGIKFDHFNSSGGALAA